MGTDGNNVEGPIHSLPASMGKTQQEMKSGWWACLCHCGLAAFPTKLDVALSWVVPYQA